MNKEQESLKVSLMLLEDKVIEIFCMSNDFYTYFDAMMEKHILKEPKKLNAQCSMRMNERSFDEKAFFMEISKVFSNTQKDCGVGV
ncbi:MAG: hypothetical protein IKP43_12235 [Bacteroidaceae bacterium]|nr:hypothetical protein [Bacteroidaceae bacterium]